MAADVGVAGDVVDAQIIVCATAAFEPLFEADLVHDESCTIAVGVHEPHAREIDIGLMKRSQIMIEDVATAIDHAGDLVFPAGEGVLDPSSTIPMQAIVTEMVEVAHSRRRGFKSLSLSGQDLFIALRVCGAGIRSS